MQGLHLYVLILNKNQKVGQKANFLILIVLFSDSRLGAIKLDTLRIDVKTP
jgi:hypothetical protein